MTFHKNGVEYGLQLISIHFTIIAGDARKHLSSIVLAGPVWLLDFPLLITTAYENTLV